MARGVVAGRVGGVTGVVLLATALDSSATLGMTRWLRYAPLGMVVEPLPAPWIPARGPE